MLPPNRLWFSRQVFTDDGAIGHSTIFTYTVAALKPAAERIRNVHEVVAGDKLAPEQFSIGSPRSVRLLGA